MKAILLDEAKKWLEENCENQYTRMAVFGIMQSMPTIDYQEPQNNPLTIEELMEMDGEPVWIKRLKELSVCDTGWAMVDVCPNQICVWWPGSEVEDTPSEKDYGETWIAYRHPPERQEDSL